MKQNHMLVKTLPSYPIRIKKLIAFEENYQFVGIIKPRVDKTNLEGRKSKTARTY